MGISRHPQLSAIACKELGAIHEHDVCVTTLAHVLAGPSWRRSSASTRQPVSPPDVAIRIVVSMAQNRRPSSNGLIRGTDSRGPPREGQVRSSNRAHGSAPGICGVWREFPRMCVSTSWEGPPRGSCRAFESRPRGLSLTSTSSAAPRDPAGCGRDAVVSFGRRHPFQNAPARSRSSREPRPMSIFRAHHPFCDTYERF